MFILKQTFNLRLTPQRHKNGITETLLIFDGSTFRDSRRMKIFTRNENGDKNPANVKLQKQIIIIVKITIR